MTALVWQVKERMKVSGIATVKDLHSRMKSIDHTVINYAQFARMVSAPPGSINARALAVMASVLGCNIGQLLAIGE